MFAVGIAAGFRSNASFAEIAGPRRRMASLRAIRLDADRRSVCDASRVPVVVLLPARQLLVHPARPVLRSPLEGVRQVVEVDVPARQEAEAGLLVLFGIRRREDQAASIAVRLQLPAEDPMDVGAELERTRRIECGYGPTGYRLFGRVQPADDDGSAFNRLELRLPEPLDDLLGLRDRPPHTLDGMGQPAFVAQDVPPSAGLKCSVSLPKVRRHRSLLCRDVVRGRRGARSRTPDKARASRRAPGAARCGARTSAAVRRGGPQRGRLRAVHADAWRLLVGSARAPRRAPQPSEPARGGGREYVDVSAPPRL